MRHPKLFVIGLLIILLTTPTTTSNQSSTSTGENCDKLVNFITHYFDHKQNSQKKSFDPDLKLQMTLII